MEYVMVPVPEELVGLVKNYMAWNLAASKTAENPEALREVFADADPQLQELIRYTARLTLAEELPTLLGASEASGMSLREIVGAVTELHTRLHAAGREGMFIMPKVDPRERPDHVSEWEHRILNMSAADAEVVLGF